MKFGYVGGRYVYFMTANRGEVAVVEVVREGFGYAVELCTLAGRGCSGCIASL
jgi:hypothetical protein